MAPIIAYIAAILGTLAVIPQIIRVIQLKDAYAISYLFLLLRIIAFLLFMLSIVLTQQYLLASSYILIIAANGYLMFLKFYYSKIKGNN